MDFSTALATWKDINLAGLQRELDKTALDLVEQQKEGLVGRKKLAEQTRGSPPGSLPRAHPSSRRQE